MDTRGQKKATRITELPTRWSIPLPADVPQQLFLKAGSKFVLGGTGTLAIVHPSPEHQRIEVECRKTFDGDPWTMLVADRRLVVVTSTGKIVCYASAPSEGSQIAKNKVQGYVAMGDNPAQPFTWPFALPKDGYALLVGLRSPGLPEQLVRTSGLQWIGIDPDRPTVEQVRQHMDDLGLYGPRFTAHTGTPASDGLPPYLAERVIVDRLPDESGQPSTVLVKTVFRVLRPYGGMAFFRDTSVDAQQQAYRSSWIDRRRCRGPQG
jgi:hypothetical protein